MLALVIILFAVAMVVGPVMLMQPTASQRRTAAIREEALKLGLRVNLLPLPMRGGNEQWPAYTLSWQRDNCDIREWLLVRDSYSHEINFSGAWQWFREPAGPQWHEALKTLLVSLPESVAGVGNGPQGLSVYWNEKGGEEVLEGLAKDLAELSQIGQARG